MTSILVIDKMNNQKPLLVLYYSQDASKNEILCLNGIKSLISNYKTKIIEENIDYNMNEEVNNISICEKLMIKISYIWDDYESTWMRTCAQLMYNYKFYKG